MVLLEEDNNNGSSTDADIIIMNNEVGDSISTTPTTLEVETNTSINIEPTNHSTTNTDQNQTIEIKHKPNITIQIPTTQQPSQLQYGYSNHSLVSATTPTYASNQAPTNFELKRMPWNEYFFHTELQHLPTRCYKWIESPLSSIIIAYIIMSLVVLCPLYPVKENLSVNNLTYLLVYLPVVGVFCFAVFFPLAYTFLNLPRIPYNIKTTLFLFLGIWNLILIGSHFLTMLGHAFPIPFQWIIIAFGGGVPIIYLLVWNSLPGYIRSFVPNANNNHSSFNSADAEKEKEKEIELERLENSQQQPAQQQPPEYESNLMTLRSSVDNNSGSPNPPTLSEPLPTPITNHHLTSSNNNNNYFTTPSGLNNLLMKSVDNPTNHLQEIAIDENHSRNISESSTQSSVSNRSAEALSDTISFNSSVANSQVLDKSSIVTDQFLQAVLIVAFQLMILVYKIIFRLSFHRMRYYLPHIPLRVFQDGRVLFLFWLELSTHCFFSMVFPHIGSWYMILIYLVMESVTLTLQVLVDTVKFRTFAIKTYESLYEYFNDTKYTGTLLHRLLGQNGELDRSVSLELFFFNCTARSLSALAYIIFSLVIYYGPNSQFYPTLNSDFFSFFMTLVYAFASFVTSSTHMVICRPILRKVYKIDMVKVGLQLWRRKPDVSFFFITNCFILPLVVLLEQNNAVSYLFTQYPQL
ncbi:hypothetical protein DFA_06244 [Cavenderia fasciculata]|uniref:Transmembrane protein n=1 Tax=Cavenderia fasciculata TaxID=261658 RepID=F4PKI1_CACFS|nr:uncharacterized protein DFA_06244 [Cavenderia fasciculata]EGG24105.1 hypothetical protein DFA_06244 [Cavenderia fasciculata]|eukprot:XP_004361956.1 hypothetical protein DFA_06244 [Cavenderia fasciculata]